jgi:uncharacterized protein (DUF2336 family)
MSEARQASTALIEIRDRMRAAPSIAVRTDAAIHVGRLLSTETLTESERQAALAILETLATDVEQRVRQALADHVKSCAILPPLLARTIAADVEAVSVPFVQFTPCLSDADLVAIVELGGISRQLAISKRATVSQRVTEALIATCSGSVITAVLENPGAVVSEPSYHAILDYFGRDDAIQGLMVERAILPITVTERLIQAVSDVLRVRLIEKHALPADLAQELVGQAGERVLMEELRSPLQSVDVEGLVRRLDAKGKLTPTLLMRALCLGDTRFFELGMAVLADIPTESAAKLIYDRGPLGFKALYEQASLAPELFRAFRAALDVLHEAKARGEESWSRRCVEEVIDRVTREYDEACPADLEYLLSQIAHRMLGRSQRSNR